MRLSREAAQALNEQRGRENSTLREVQATEIIQKAEESASDVAQRRQYYEDALKGYNESIARNPFDSKAFYGLGNTCYALQRYTAAFNTYGEAIRLHPIAAAWAGIGDIFAKLRQYQQAVEAYEEALRLDDEVTLDYDDLVESLMALGREQEAEHYRERARELGYYDE